MILDWHGGYPMGGGAKKAPGALSERDQLQVG